MHASPPGLVRWASAVTGSRQYLGSSAAIGPHQPPREAVPDEVAAVRSLQLDVGRDEGPARGLHVFLHKSPEHAAATGATMRRSYPTETIATLRRTPTLSYSWRATASGSALSCSRTSS